ncbi:MAG: alpha/beta hydrolase [Burkholderiaceae bacterium]
MQLSANGVLIEVDDQGPPDAPPVLLIMGLGMQLVAWPQGFVNALLRAGFRVIRFDNRDVGLSQSFDHAGVPNIAVELAKYSLGMKVNSAYTLSDLADDAAGVLDALGIAGAHVCGASMGGMVAQRLALRRPERVKSLTLMMTSSGARHLPGPTLKVRAAMLSRPRKAGGMAAILAYYVRLYRLISSPGFPTDDGEIKARVEAWVRRAYRPQANLRQVVAIAADGDRSSALAGLRVPTQIIHGRADTLVPVAAAHDLVAKIAGAGLDIVDGMGHDLPEPLWPRFVSVIQAAAR